MADEINWNAVAEKFAVEDMTKGETKGVRWVKFTRGLLWLEFNVDAGWSADAVAESMTRTFGAPVEPLRGGRPLISDIPNMMRMLADRIESGDVPAEYALCIIPRDGDFPDLFGWGEHPGDLGNIAICELAKMYFVTNLTKRN